MLGAGGGGGSPFGPAPFLLGGGGVGAAKSLLPSFLVPKGNQPTACTLALWWLKFGPTEPGRGGGGGCRLAHPWALNHRTVWCARVCLEIRRMRPHGRVP